MKKLVLIVTAFLGLSAGSASATCTGPAIMHDFAGTPFNMSLATNAGDGNCASNVGIIGTLPPFASTPTFNIGTSSLALETGGNLASINTKTPALGQAVAASSVPVVLPATQITALTPPTSIGVNNFPATQPISAASLPLPSGAATSANQSTEIGSLATIATNSAAQATAANQATANTSLATIATNSAGANPLNVNSSVTAQTGLTPGTAQTGPIVAANQDITSVGGKAVPKGGVPVINGGNTYNTVAASVTAQALTGGSGGATGDYLSHCVVQPTTTAAGTVTIADNTTTIFTFTAGTLSNLAPFAIPVGANSVSGAWKITTGANETVTCVGKFS